MSARALTKLGRSADIPQDQRDHLFRFSSNDAYPPFPSGRSFIPPFGKRTTPTAQFLKIKSYRGASSQIQHELHCYPVESSDARSKLFIYR